MQLPFYSSKGLISFEYDFNNNVLYITCLPALQQQQLQIQNMQQNSKIQPISLDKDKRLNFKLSIDEICKIIDLANNKIQEVKIIRDDKAISFMPSKKIETDVYVAATNGATASANKTLLTKWLDFILARIFENEYLSREVDKKQAVKMG